MADFQGESGTAIIRPHVFVLAGWGLVCAGCTVVGLEGALRDLQSSRGAAAMFIAVVGCLGLLYGARQRVEIDGPLVRIVGLASVDEFPRSDIVTVVRAGGRGKPSYLQLRTDRETSGRYLDAAQWPPRVKRQRSVAAYPALIGAKQLGQRLGVPVEPWRKRPPNSP